MAIPFLGSIASITSASPIGWAFAQLVNSASRQGNLRNETAYKSIYDMIIKNITSMLGGSSQIPRPNPNPNRTDTNNTSTISYATSGPGQVLINLPTTQIASVKLDGRSLQYSSNGSVGTYIRGVNTSNASSVIITTNDEKTYRLTQ
jgi:hypothetical protein